MVEISDVAEYRCCLTCVWRQFYPPARASSANPFYHRFLCGRADLSGKSVVRPENVCPDGWQGATLVFE